MERTPPVPKILPASAMASAPHAKRPYKIAVEDKTCPKCGKVMQSRQALRIHLNRVYPCDAENSSDNAKTCPKCGRKFTMAAGLSLHLRKATPCDAPGATHSGAFKCEKCNEVFASARSLLAHHNRVYACDDPTHTRTWQGGRTCPKCNTTFCNGQSLRLHLNRAIPCDAEMPSTSENTRTLNATGKEDGESKTPDRLEMDVLHRCPQCQRSFTTPRGLHIHMGRCLKSLFKLTKPKLTEDDGDTSPKVEKQNEGQNQNHLVKTAIQIASVELVNDDEISEATTTTDSPCSSPSTEVKGTECGEKDLVTKASTYQGPGDGGLKLTAQAFSSHTHSPPLQEASTSADANTSQSGKRKSLINGNEGLSPVEKSKKRACTDTATFAKLVARLAEKGPATTADEKAANSLPTNEVAESKSKESNGNHGGDILADGCCCRPCVRKWARKMTNRLGNLSGEVEKLCEAVKTDVSSVATDAQVSSTASRATGKPRSRPIVPGYASAGGNDIKLRQEQAVSAATLDTISEQDPGKISLLENYNHVNGQIIINERALEDSIAYLNQISVSGGLNDLEMRDQIDELRGYLNLAKSKRDKAVASIIAHRWSARRNEFRRLLEKMTVKSKPDAEKVFHEECADIAVQLVEKDHAISELKIRGNTKSNPGKDREGFSRFDAERAAKILLERERDELFMRLLRSSRRIYLLAKDTFVLKTQLL